MKLTKPEIYLNIYPTRDNCKIIFFKKEKNKIEILSEIEKNIYMENRIFIEKSAREEYINEISSYINNEKLKYSKCKSVFINIQENDVIIKNIKVDPEVNKKDIIKVANIEIKEFCTNCFKKYCIDYKNVYNNESGTVIQVVLFPKKYIDLFYEVCKRIGIEEKAMHTNFDLVERMLNIGGSKIMGKRRPIGVVEFRKNDLVISIFRKQKVIKSYVIRKDEFNKEIAENIFSDCDGIMSLGNDNLGDIKIIQQFADVMKVDFETDIEFVKDYKRVSAEEYFNISGKMLN